MGLFGAEREHSLHATLPALSPPSAERLAAILCELAGQTGAAWHLIRQACCVRRHASPLADRVCDPRLCWPLVQDSGRALLPGGCWLCHRVRLGMDGSVVDMAVLDEADPMLLEPVRDASFVHMLRRPALRVPAGAADWRDLGLGRFSEADCLSAEQAAGGSSSRICRRSRPQVDVVSDIGMRGLSDGRFDPPCSQSSFASLVSLCCLCSRRQPPSLTPSDPCRPLRRPPALLPPAPPAPPTCALFAFSPPPCAASSSLDEPPIPVCRWLRRKRRRALADGDDGPLVAAALQHIGPLPAPLELSLRNNDLAASIIVSAGAPQDIGRHRHAGASTCLIGERRLDRLRWAHSVAGLEAPKRPRRSLFSQRL